MAEPIRRDADRRRSQRVLLRVRVVVHGKAVNGSPIEEETLTTVVNAHGALIDLAARVESGQAVVLQNKDTGEKQECRVAHLGPRQGEKSQIGLEFAQPAPRFWHIDFPPEAWNSQQGAAKPVPEAQQAKKRT
jgi:hypothetical protein